IQAQAEGHPSKIHQGGLFAWPMKEEEKQKREEETVVHEPETGRTEEEETVVHEPETGRTEEEEAVVHEPETGRTEEEEKPESDVEGSYMSEEIPFETLKICESDVEGSCMSEEFSLWPPLRNGIIIDDSSDEVDEHLQPQDSAPSFSPKFQPGYFLCPVVSCGRKLKTRGALTMHQRTHNTKCLAKEGHEAEVEEAKHFLLLMKHHQNSVFGDAKYMINQSRQERLRLPSRIPLREQMQKLRDFSVGRIKELSNHSDDVMKKRSYIELRNLVCSRLTLFNARRGGEPARLKIDHWTERQKWIGEKDPEHEKWFRGMEIMYSTGKGNHLVSTIVPADCIKALDLLVDFDNRSAARILQENAFIFASTNSQCHCSGWSCTDVASAKAGVTERINATKQRGRISTFYAAADLPYHERELFYAHMGHSEEVNQGTYQQEGSSGVEAEAQLFDEESNVNGSKAMLDPEEESVSEESVSEESESEESESEGNEKYKKQPK
ncbi:hypothetical protein CAPTEDRAFT_208970, partial [Capitella teleta]